MKRCLPTTCIALLALSAVTARVRAEAVTWNGAGDMNWTSPDSTSWSGLTYDDGDTPTFDGSGPGTVTVVGTVSPGNMSFSAGTYTIEGGTIAGSGDLNKSGSTLTLANVNTYSGRTYVLSGTMTMKGKDAISPNSTIRIGTPRSGITLRLLMDDVGTINLGNELEVVSLADSVNGTGVYTVHVANNGGATSNSTIAFAKVDFSETQGDADTSVILRATGANGYKLQVGDCDLNVFKDLTGYPGPQGFFSDTAPITITGTIKQINGNAGNTFANRLFLGGVGTTTTNYVTGTIADPDDYPGNPLAQPLGLRIGDGNNDQTPQSDALWCLSGKNTFTGPTVVRYGTLILAGGTSGECLSDTASLTIESNGKVQIESGTREAVGSLFFGAAEQAIGEWGSSQSSANNVDDTYFSGKGLLYVGMKIPPSGTVLILR